MSMRMRDVMMRNMAELRHEPIAKRIRATLGDSIAVDSSRAVLVWEPRRITPLYAVPDDDLRAELVPVELVAPSDAPVLHPGIPFAHHSTEGQPFAVKLGGESRDQAAFRPA